MSNNTIAKTILQQMGGTGRICAMTGAKRFVDHGDGVSFRFPNKAAGRPNHVKITLNGSDLYDVRFIRIRGTNFKTTQELSGVYCDMLKELFETQTGLYLSL